MATIDGWWFGTRDKDGLVRESYGERRVVRVGETLVYDGTPSVCLSGLHASPDPLLALCAAPKGATVVHRVRLGGLIVGPQEGKYAAQRRLTLWMADCAALLRLVAADYAERALFGERGAGREPDARSWTAVEAARAYARGQIDAEALRAAKLAARAVAPSATPWSASEWTALAAAWTAAEEDPSWVAQVAATAVAVQAADAAVTRVGRAADEAWQAERRWQSERLTEALMALAPEAAGEGAVAK